MFRIKPFNLVFFIFITIFIVIGIVFHYMLKDRSEKIRRNALISMSVFNILYFIVYKIALFKGNSDLEAVGFKFNIWKELPLHMCNITLFLIPYGLIRDRKFFLGYSFYLSALGASLALITPNRQFVNSNIYYLGTLGYYGFHIIVVINSILLVSLGFFRPSFKEFPSVILSFLMLASAAHVINLIIRVGTGVTSNYFYTMWPENISPLEMLWRWIPHRFIYLFPSLILFAGVMVIETIPFIIHRKKKLNVKKNHFNRTKQM